MPFTLVEAGREKEFVGVIFFVVTIVYSLVVAERYRRGDHSKASAVAKGIIAWFLLGALFYFLWKI
jgi:hypothetical protein